LSIWICIYLASDLRQEFDLIADEMDTQRRRRNGERVERIHHFEPLIAALGLEQIEDLDDGELYCRTESRKDLEGTSIHRLPIHRRPMFDHLCPTVLGDRLAEFDPPAAGAL
jgi:hypothetical protein